MSTLTPTPLLSPNSYWIWPADHPRHQNQYIEVRHAFSYDGKSHASLSIAADARYAVWVNDRFIGQGPFPDWPQFRPVDVWMLEDALQVGANWLRIRIHWIGVDTASYVIGDPGVIYTLAAEDQILAASGEGAEWMPNPCYRTTALPKISPQLGFSFAYDAGLEACLEDETRWIAITQSDCKSVTTTGRSFRSRPLPPCKLGERAQAHIVAQGYYRKGDCPLDAPLASRMQRDWLSARKHDEIFADPPPSPIALGAMPLKFCYPTIIDADGVYWIIDLGTEVCGYLDIEINTREPVLLEIAYGEHLDDLRVRSQVGQRFFAVSYRSRVGHQVFLEPITLFGGRYLQVHASGFSGELNLHYLGLRQSYYPIAERGNFQSIDSIVQKIYETSVRTLKLCMGNHYFDTPWREQALYANDLLNQSLAGYYAFGDYQYPQASISLLGCGLREDGFLELCAPARLPITIPAFSFAWVMALEKNLLYSGDVLYAQSQFDRVQIILNQATDRISEGLLPSPVGPGYWHFYDWTSGGLDGTMDGDATRFTPLQHTRFDAPLNAFFLLAKEAGVKLAETLGAHEQKVTWKSELKEARRAFHHHFFDPKRNTYRTFKTDRAIDTRPSELVQALALLAQCCPLNIATGLREQLLHAKEKWIPSSLSQSLYTFEALAQDYRFIEPMIERVNEIWGSMITHGATTFWETQEAGRAFDGAGSMCHGWSAIPAYLYGAYLLGVRPLTPGFKTFTHSPLRPLHFRGSVPTPGHEIQVG